MFATATNQNQTGNTHQVMSFYQKPPGNPYTW